MNCNRKLHPFPTQKFNMVIFKKVSELRQYLNANPFKEKKLGFIPTMGALHNGHISLINRAKAENLATICSIFVNPTQFNDPKDFEKYPISTKDDIQLLLEADCDVLFLPSVEEIYPNGSSNTISYNFGYLETVLEGAQRPGHFKGVGQVVGRLLEIVLPHTLLLGQKDYQQCMVVQDLMRQMVLSPSPILLIGPTIREADGLAMSSRNRRLTEPQRIITSTIYQCLVSIKSKNGHANFEIVKKECWDLLTAKGLDPEYIDLAVADTLELIPNYSEQHPMVALIAVKIGAIRLIDNMLL